MDEKFEPHIKSLFNQTDGHNIRIETKLYLREVILLDIQLEMDLFCNIYLVEKTTNSKTKMRLKSNVGTMKVSHQETESSYHNIVWFSENPITNIIALSNLRLQYLVT